MGRRGEGDGRAAGHIVCDVSSCAIVILHGKRDLQLSRSLQIGDGIAGLCGSQSIIHTGVVAVGSLAAGPFQLSVQARIEIVFLDRLRETAARDGDGCIRRTALNNRSLCSSKLTAGNVHNRILAADFGNSICGTGERTTGHGKSTKINISTTTTVVNAVCLCVSVTCSSKGAACDLCNIVILNNGLIIVAERTAIDR